MFLYWKFMLHCTDLRNKMKIVFSFSFLLFLQTEWSLINTIIYCVVCGTEMFGWETYIKINFTICLHHRWRLILCYGINLIKAELRWSTDFLTLSPTPWNDSRKKHTTNIDLLSSSSFTFAAWMDNKCSCS